MIPLFSEQGRLRLDAIVQPGLLCAFDFDGTLAPLVAQPDAVRLPADIRHRLLELAEYAPVAVITGRALDDIRRRVGFEPDFIIGNHGIEGLPGWEKQATEFQALCRNWKAQLSAALQDEAECKDGVLLEDKRYSLSVHYRMARVPEQAEARLPALFSRMDPPPKVVSGKFVFNLLPASAADKGTALERLIEVSAARSAIYIGDDVTDEDVFKLNRPDLLSVRVEYSAGTAADFYLDRLEDMARLLDELTRRLREMQATNWTRLNPAASARNL